MNECPSRSLSTDLTNPFIAQVEDARGEKAFAMLKLVPSVEDNVHGPSWVAPNEGTIHISLLCKSYLILFWMI